MDKPRSNYSDYIIFIDESGDHGLANIDNGYPIFVLVFAVIKKSDYIDKIAPNFQKLKFDYFGHDQVIFHEHDIRKEQGVFSVLRTNSKLRENFISDLSLLMKECPFTFFASIVNKEDLRKRYINPNNPYEIGMLFCAEKSLEFLLSQQQQNKKVHLVIEGRGNKENRELELEFRRICDNQSKIYSASNFKQMDLELIYSDKKTNSVGLQIADLIARPLGINKLRPEQNNRAYKTIADKGVVKIFP
ncbi:MAG: DUF3800 domain-containing protein [Proteobacteria bacterium]|nr:DUF3800 domain-containing protein [Pseudomonadota bacterium]